MAEFGDIEEDMKKQLESARAYYQAGVNEDISEAEKIIADYVKSIGIEDETLEAELVESEAKPFRDNIKRAAYQAAASELESVMMSYRSAVLEHTDNLTALYKEAQNLYVELQTKALKEGIDIQMSSGFVE